MKIAVLSGKGGAGKTLFAVNLAAAAEEAWYVDCDVEEPNGHLFFQPTVLHDEEVLTRIPAVDQQKCSHCRVCTEFCNYNALAFIRDHIKVFDDLCHSCGGCMLLCPQQAISEKAKSLGTIRSGISQNVTVFSGFLKAGEASGVPIIKKLMDSIPEQPLTFVDCPPGSACTVMESIKKADYCVLVAESSKFGVHNLEMVHELVQVFKKPYGVMINKDIDSEGPAARFCLDHNIKVLANLPFDTNLGRIHSDGQIAARSSEKYRKMFKTLLQMVLKEAQNETAASYKR